MEEKYNAIIQRIRARRIDLNMSYQDLADMTDMSKSTLQRYETGDIRNLPLSKLEIIAKALRVTPAYLMGWSDNMFSSIPVTVFHQIPVIGTVRAGFGTEIFAEHLGFEHAADLKNPDEYRYLKVKGDSMMPDIKEGDLALVHIQPEVENGELAVVIVDGEEGMLKKVTKHDGAISLVSFNASYPPRLLFYDGKVDVTIWGKVVKIERKY